MAVIGADIDGTLLDYGHKFPNPHLANLPLINLLSRKTNSIHLITNQGGIGMGLVPIDGWIDRIEFLAKELRRAKIRVLSLQVALYHPKADLQKIESIAADLRSHLKRSSIRQWTVYASERARKPNPLMLRHTKIAEYWGDSTEDEQAALAAGAIFQKVERFVG